ncbi:unnamed protein product [Strongylus vulgaris]|uniref:Uncharacterized protein n=1 Tax=Strongylus vulgaris TaxID=40348 RepID=A0A3P7JNJ8_STRVU|nr:unnamed protein product [Strongylus vulgaris]
MCDIPTCVESSLNRTRRSYDNDSSITVDVQSQRIEVSELGLISDVESEGTHSMELTCHEKASYPIQEICLISDVESEGTHSMELTCHEKASYPVQEICVPFNPFVVFLAGMISVIVFVAFTAVMVSLQRYRHYSMSETRC